MIEPSHALIEARATAGAQERARLAREIHDGLAQDLAGLGYRLDELATAPGIAPDERGEIREIRATLSETIGQLRQSIFDLRTSDFDFISEVRQSLDELESVGIQVSFDCNFDTSILSATTTRQLRAIAVEALTNVIRHANATHLQFTLVDYGNSIEMVIKDDGVGNVGTKEFSYGLATMSERADSIGATCTIENPEYGGTIIKVRAPQP